MSPQEVETEEVTDPATVRVHSIEHDWNKHYPFKQGDVFVEIGGFWGHYAKKAYEEGCSKVIIVEPAPANMLAMKTFLSESSVPLDRIQIVSKAITDHKGLERLIVWGNPSGYQLAGPGQEKHYLTVPVDVDTLEGLLDSLGVDRVDLLGSDCEGQEINLIKYAGRWTREHKIKHFAIGAYHDPQNASILKQLLEKEGYIDLSYEDAILFARAPD